KATSVIMAAAVADFSPASVSKKKHEKESISSLKLKKNPDILRKLGSISGSRVLVGFAAETGKDLARAKSKLKEKNLDIIVFNDVTQKGAGFDVETNIVTIIDRKGHAAEYPIMKKIEVADAILDKLAELLPRKKK
ncbi:MAG: bifunctional 4'-phosphopantothenoylcysteine decarboxylase/phosphopantothenoylcysteine synthetase, partial [Nitrospirota bacterium]|nr:bifunctional 4'-phosphopantothenoylcysteine decarboxylase/phosphopantothenoylcysteine synthetase [Nitrospirota bacterium]